MTSRYSDSLEDKRKAVAAEIVSLEEQITELSTLHEELYKSGQQIPIEGPKSRRALDVLYRRLNNARQAQLSYLLASIDESSNRLEAATKNLKESSESQVEVTKSLLRSSHRLEQFALFLIALTALSIFVVEQSIAPSDPTLKTIWLVLGIVSIVALMILAYRWPLVKRGKSTSAQA